jgi:hypothetical protein
MTGVFSILASKERIHSWPPEALKANKVALAAFVT